MEIILLNNGEALNISRENKLNGWEEECFKATSLFKLGRYILWDSQCMHIIQIKLCGIIQDHLNILHIGKLIFNNTEINKNLWKNS